MQHEPDSQELMNRYSRLQERFEWLGGYEYEAMSRKIIHGLGFAEADMDRLVQSFSGGQKTRINLAKALVCRPDYLFLDEPTNHLDMEMLEWLESYLLSYGGGILIVSHDRYFLDRVTTSILEMENGTITKNSGSNAAKRWKTLMKNSRNRSRKQRSIFVNIKPVLNQSRLVGVNLN
jgi:ATP-binding cassette subfamily F protein 3